MRGGERAGRVANEQRGLARRHQAGLAVGPEGRAGLVEVEGAEHVAVKEAVLAAAPVLATPPCRPLPAQSQRLRDPRRLRSLDHLCPSVGSLHDLADHAIALAAPRAAFAQIAQSSVTGGSHASAAFAE